MQRKRRFKSSGHAGRLSRWTYMDHIVSSLHIAHLTTKKEQKQSNKSATYPNTVQKKPRNAPVHNPPGLRGTLLTGQLVLLLRLRFLWVCLPLFMMDR